MPLPSPPIERAKPLLGTIVRIRVDGLPSALANEVISGAFDRVAEIHRLMSFHEPQSELTRVNCEAACYPVPVSPHTYAVLSHALELAEASTGLFDPTIAPALVRDGLLPALAGEPPASDASWKDVALSPDGTVAYGKPLWLDLGGIAKGYAVDCAFDYIASHRPDRIYVEAGGDLRLSGPQPEPVYLAAPYREGAVPAVMIENASVASSGSQWLCDEIRSPQLASAHIDPRTGHYCRLDRFVTVVAPRCMDADALTKVVMAAGTASAPILDRYQALAFMLDGAGWTSLGANAPTGAAA
ncbi:FAD:protein FMN transferase [Dyella choica]|nr:FAD:protein FMN transferase [Dyella choica]